MKDNIVKKSFEDFHKLSPRFTGERYTIGSGIRIAYEHFNRYCFALNNIEPGEVVLDLGCGTGYGSILLAQKAHSVYAVDIDQTSLDLLSVVCKKYNINNVYPIKSDINLIDQSAGIPTGKINSVVCHELIEHIGQTDQLALVNKISSAVGPFAAGCKLFISTPEKETYNAINIAHNEFHLQELSKDEFEQLLSRSFKNTKYFWQMPIGGDLILSSECLDKAEAVSYLNWNNRVEHVGYPSSIQPIEGKGIYMYAICSNSELTSKVRSSLLIDTENRELIERFAIAADELRKLSQLKDVSTQQEVDTIVKPVTLSAEEKVQTASAKKIKNLIFEAERIAGERTQLDLKCKKLELELTKVSPLLKSLEPALLTRIADNPELVAEAVSYYDLKHRFAHRFANYLIFKLQRRKPVILLNKFYKFVRLVMAS